jgi:Right handed beta helix region
VLTANSSGLITSRRIHVQNYEETIYNSGSMVLAEDSLYEGLTAANSDCLEIQGGQPGSIVRRNTFRRSTGSNSDAIDFNGTSGARIESCLIHDISDKGVSMGASGQGGSPDLGIVISNCLIYRVNTGVAVKDGGTASLLQSTISQSPIGLHSYQKFTSPVGGGQITNGYNNIIWGNTVSLILTNGGTVAFDHCDVEGTNYPGTGNISADPLFIDSSKDDFRLAAGSPAIGTGLGGVDMGVRFPVGGLPSGPVNLAAHAPGLNPIQIWWQEDADNETGFAVERSTDAATWQALATVPANVTNYTDTSSLVEQRYFYRVRATNGSGNSRYSNIASAVRQAAVVYVGGVLTSNTVWSPAQGTYIVLSNIIVPTNLSLTLLPGTLVKLTNNVTITAQAGGSIHIEGTAENQVVLQRWNGTNNWGEIRAEGTNASIIIRHADISGGQTTVYNGATGLFEDSYFHSFHQQAATTIFNQPIVLAHFPGSAVMRRCHINDYYEVLWRHGMHLIEDSLFENMVGDALDFDAAFPGTIVRRCTFRHGRVTNVDGMDVGNDGTSSSAGVTLESCLMYDFPFDKGVSIGESSKDIVVTNCMMYGCNWAIGVKDSSTAGIYNNTLSGNDEGIRLYNKIAGQGSGIVTNSFNNLIWGNPDGSIVPLDGGTIVVSYTDTMATNYPGTGNINSDPLFVNAAEHDYRLLPGSPCIGTGLNGATMGAHYPVGSFLALSHPRVESIVANGGSAVVRFWADYERTYSLLSSDSAAGGVWTKVADVGTNDLPHLVSVTNNAAATQRFYKLVTPKLP